MTQRDITFSQALTITDTIANELRARRGAAAVAVVDAHGELVAFVRTDGCPLQSITIAQNKAYTAARERVPSEVIGQRSRDEGFPLTNYGDRRIVGWGGGHPIVVDDHVIGAVGVSGLPEEIDMELARLGASSIADS